MRRIVERYAFLPPQPPTYKPSDVTYIRTQTRLIPYRLIKASGPHPFINKYTIIFVHGNACDIGEVYPRMRQLNELLNVNILFFDYSGYGYNGVLGNCSEAEMYEDTEKVYHWATDFNDIPAGNIILYGQSLGTGAVTHLASKLSTTVWRPLAGVILQSPMTSALRVVTSYLSWVPTLDIMCSIDRMHKINVPVFIIHGDQDEIIPYEHSRQLSKKTEHLWKFWTVGGAGHNNVEIVGGDEMTTLIRNFLSSLHMFSYYHNEPSFSSLTRPFC